MPFDKNVFINCPFDDQYKPLLKSLVFELIYLGFTPILCQTESSSIIRGEKIKKLIKSCKYSIHDLSRSQAMCKGELPRFNMPYELGLDIGAFTYGSGKLKSKKILILETEKHHYQKVISDIAGQDIENHEDEPKTLITKVRNWLSAVFVHKRIAGSSEIWNAYNQFLDDLQITLKKAFYTEKDIDEMPIGEFIDFSKDWVKKFQT